MLVCVAVELDCVDEEVADDVELGFGALVVVVVVDLVCALSGAAIASVASVAMRIFMSVPPVRSAAMLAATAVIMLSGT
jgi:hypothetical protein